MKLPFYDLLDRFLNPVKITFSPSGGDRRREDRRELPDRRCGERRNQTDFGKMYRENFDASFNSYLEFIRRK